MNENGCLKSYHCEGGAVCVDNQCRCPPGYSVPLGYSKCIRDRGNFYQSLRGLSANVIFFASMTERCMNNKNHPLVRPYILRIRDQNSVWGSSIIYHFTIGMCCPPIVWILFCNRFISSAYMQLFNYILRKRLFTHLLWDITVQGYCIDRWSFDSQYDVS